MNKMRLIRIFTLFSRYSSSQIYQSFDHQHKVTLVAGDLSLSTAGKLHDVFNDVMLCYVIRCDAVRQNMK